MKFPLIDTISQYVSPSIEVQEFFKKECATFIKVAAVSSVILTGLAELFGLWNHPVMDLSPLSAYVITLATSSLCVFAIGSIGTIAVIAFFSQFQSYDLDAEAHAKELSQDRKEQLVLLRVIKNIPQNDRKAILDNAKLFFTEKTSVSTKYITLLTLNNFSKEIIETLLEEDNRNLVIGLFTVTPHPLILFLMLKSKEGAKKVITLGKNFLEDNEIKATILNELQVMIKALNDHVNSLEPEKKGEVVLSFVKKKVRNNLISGSRLTLYRAFLVYYGEHFEKNLIERYNNTSQMLNKIIEDNTEKKRNQAIRKADTVLKVNPKA